MVQLNIFPGAMLGHANRVRCTQSDNLELIMWNEPGTEGLLRIGEGAGCKRRAMNQVPQQVLFHRQAEANSWGGFKQWTMSSKTL